MNEDIMFSIVIPIYNTGAFLERCVRSILTQTYQKLEVILVDDGSTDQSAAICDAFALADVRVRVIHQMNLGQSAARNAGILAARGEYVGFLDSDDYWLRSDSLEKIAGLSDTDKQSDLLMFGYRKVWKNTGKIRNKCTKTTVRGSDDPIRALVQAGEYSNSACNKFVRRDFLLRHKLLFREGSFCEDVEWCGKILRLNPKGVCTLQDPVMVYEVKSNTSAAPSMKSYTDFMRVFKEETDNLMDTSLDSHTRETCYAYWAYQMSWFLSYPKRIGPDCFQTAKQECKPLLFVFDYALDKKARLVRSALHVIGLPLTMRLLPCFV